MLDFTFSPGSGAICPIEILIFRDHAYINYIFQRVLVNRNKLGDSLLKLCSENALVNNRKISDCKCFHNKLFGRL